MREQEMLLRRGHRVDKEQMLARRCGGMCEQKPLLCGCDRMNQQ
jgi:hypothetical protein